MTTFTATWPYSNIFSPLIAGSAKPFFVDTDNDGVQDLFVGDNSGQIRYFHNTGTSSVPAFIQLGETSNLFNGVDVGTLSAPTLVDVDNDGDQDAFIGASDGTILYYKNTGSAAAPAFLSTTGASNPFNGVDVGSFSTPTFVDIDNDGDQDAFSGALNGTILYYKNTGSAAVPAFLAQTGASNPFNGVDVGGASTPTFLDIDNDGDKDAFIGEGNGTIYYYKNTGSATAPAFLNTTGAGNPFNGIDVGDIPAPTFVDIDNDGDKDAFIGNANGDVLFYKNTGSTAVPAFLAQTGASTPLVFGIDVSSSSAPTFVDIDNDGDKDLFVSDIFGTISYYKNTGSASVPLFLAQAGVSNPFNGVDVGLNATFTCVDIDGDGDQDAFIGERTGVILYYKNTGSAVSPVFLSTTGGSNPFNGVDVGDYAAPTFVDIDNDGDQDAFIGASDGTIKYHRNTGSAATPTFLAQTGASNPFNGVEVEVVEEEEAHNSPCRLFQPIYHNHRPPAASAPSPILPPANLASPKSAPHKISRSTPTSPPCVCSTAIMWVAQATALTTSLRGMSRTTSRSAALAGMIRLSG